MNEQDFIAVFDGAAPVDQCNALIQHFEAMARLGLAFPRDTAAHVKDDHQVFLMENLKVGNSDPVIKPFLDLLGVCWRQYTAKFSVLKDAPKHGVMSMKLQKTDPGGGYHVWHCEDLNQRDGDRIAVFMLYLNNVEHGGETEFLYLRRRVEARMGRLLIWPAGFTHTHRGNTPLSGTKYILTGWVEWVA